LADYIATDRSAMMRELKRLREEGVIRSDGRKFTLYL
jgi:CRP-like cAMP-binding protein